jgi:hypothetical protein
MAAKLTRLTHKIAMQLHLVTENCTICSSRCRRPVRKLLYKHSYNGLAREKHTILVGRSEGKRRLEDLGLGGRILLNHHRHHHHHHHHHHRLRRRR